MNCTLVLLAAAAPAVAQQKAQHDSAFHNMQMRGKVVMGVDQYKSTHVFEDLADGGRIELQADSADAKAVAAIRQHLKAIAEAFAKGDFSAPALVHMKAVPGTTTMAAKRAVITYAVKELPRGGQVRIVTTDAAGVRAVHQFLAFQRAEHHVH